MTFKSFNISVLCLLGAALILSWFSEDLKSILAQKLESKHVVSTTALAQITALKGRAQARYNQSSEFHELEKNEQLRHLDRIKTEAQSELTVRFKSDYLVRISPSSEVTLELWNPKDAKSPVYIHIISGSIRVDQVGSRGQLYVLNKGRLTSADLLNLQQSYPLPSPDSPTNSTAQKNTDNDAKLEIEGASELEALSDPSLKKPSQSAPAPAPKGQTTQATLSNSYIDERINKQSQNLRKCQTNSLRKQIPAIGEMLIGFQITPEGRIQDIRVLQSQITNEELTQCVISVFRRVYFKPFKGLPILRTFPIIFK